MGAAFPVSDILGYRESVGSINSSCMNYDMSSSEMVDTFQEITFGLMEIHFPLKRISVSPYDKPWMCEELRILRRCRQRVYMKQGRSTKYLNKKGNLMPN